MKKIFYSDIEATGLLNQLIEQGDKAKLHNLCAVDSETKTVSLFHADNDIDKARIEDFLNQEIILVMHNGICYDKTALQFFKYNVNKVTFVDTLALSWYLDIKRDLHGLDSYGTEAGVPKPVIKDWKDLTQEDYDHRVLEDVKIQEYVFKKLKARFEELYGKMTDYEFCTHKVVKYLNFKMEQLAEQQNSKIRVDVPHSKELLAELEQQIDFKKKQLAEVMPKVPVYSKHTKPAKPFLKSGGLSSIGLKWKELCEKANVDFNYDGEIKAIRSYDEPNPSSSQQIKNWLFSLGWEPELFKFVKDENGERKIPQIYKPQSGGQICNSIELLAEDRTELQHLVGLSVLSHRKGCVNGFIDSLVFGEYIEATAAGFTNTLRLKHRKPCVNLPSAKVSYGDQVRACLISREGKILMGSDLSSLENKIKFNLQLPYDRKYVLDQMSDDYDPHLEIARDGNLIGQAEVDFYKIVKEGFPVEKYEQSSELLNLLSLNDNEKKEKIKHISKQRAKGKTCVYACLPMDTTVLTPTGFKSFKDLNIGDKVYSYKDGEIVEDFIKFKHFYTDAKVIHYGDSKKTIRATANHKWLTQKRVWNNDVRKNEIELTEPKLVPMDEFTSETQILTTAKFSGGYIHNIDAAEFVGWMLSEGYFSANWGIAQSINYFTEDIEDCLQRLGLSYSKSTREKFNGNDVDQYVLRKNEVKPLLDSVEAGYVKNGFNWSQWVLKLSYESLQAFIGAFWKGDGDLNNRSFTITQNKGDVADAVLLGMYLLGNGRCKQEDKGDKCSTLRQHKTPRISFQRKTIQKTTFEDVFCLTTTNGSFVIKQDNEILLTGNCQYGAGGAKVALAANVPLAIGKQLVKAYKKLNWSIQKIAQNQTRKTVSHGTYQLNPYNDIWYYLKAEKDAFSTLVQGTGSYVLDCWLKSQFTLRDSFDFKEEPKLLATFHDEQIVELLDEDQAKVRFWVEAAMGKLNDIFKLEIPFGCDIQFGKDYSKIH